MKKYNFDNSTTLSIHSFGYKHGIHTRLNVKSYVIRNTELTFQFIYDNFGSGKYFKLTSFTNTLYKIRKFHNGR